MTAVLITGTIGSAYGLVSLLTDHIDLIRAVQQGGHLDSVSDALFESKIETIEAEIAALKVSIQNAHN